MKSIFRSAFLSGVGLMIIVVSPVLATPTPPKPPKPPKPAKPAKPNNQSALIQQRVAAARQHTIATTQSQNAQQQHLAERAKQAAAANLVQQAILDAVPTVPTPRN